MVLQVILNEEKTRIARFSKIEGVVMLSIESILECILDVEYGERSTKGLMMLFQTRTVRGTRDRFVPIASAIEIINMVAESKRWADKLLWFIKMEEEGDGRVHDILNKE